MCGLLLQTGIKAPGLYSPQQITVKQQPGFSISQWLHHHCYLHNSLHSHANCMLAGCMPAVTLKFFFFPAEICSAISLHCSGFNKAPSQHSFFLSCFPSLWSFIPVSPADFLSLSPLGTEGLRWWWRWLFLSLSTWMCVKRAVYTVRSLGSHDQVWPVTSSSDSPPLDEDNAARCRRESRPSLEGMYKAGGVFVCHEFSSSSCLSLLLLFRELTTSFTQW